MRDGARLAVSRPEFERILWEGDARSGLSVEGSEWEAATVTDMLADLERGIKAEFAMRGRREPDYSVSCANALTDDDMVVNLVVHGPKADEAEIQEILELTTHRVVEEDASDSLIVSRELAEALRSQASEMETKDFPLASHVTEEEGARGAAVDRVGNVGVSPGTAPL